VNVASDPSPTVKVTPWSSPCALPTFEGGGALVAVGGTGDGVGIDVVVPVGSGVLVGAAVVVGLGVTTVVAVGSGLGVSVGGVVLVGDAAVAGVATGLGASLGRDVAAGESDEPQPNTSRSPMAATSAGPVQRRGGTRYVRITTPTGCSGANDRA
jgi:hypothetical protein